MKISKNNLFLSSSLPLPLSSISLSFLFKYNNKYFSQTERNNKMLKDKKIKEIEERKYIIIKNKIFEGMNTKNTDE
jgi:hypothetical protein